MGEAIALQAQLSEPIVDTFLRTEGHFEGDISTIMFTTGACPLASVMGMPEMILFPKIKLPPSVQQQPLCVSQSETKT